MAYNWDWNRKGGTFTYNDYTYNFYVGNGFMIVIDEFTVTEERAEKCGVDDNLKVGEEAYRVVWFFIDKDHAKRCLGVLKGYDNMFEGLVQKIVIYKDNCHNWKDIVDLFTKTQPNIVIEIHPHAPEKEEK